MPRLNVKLTNESPRALSVCFVAAFAQRRGSYLTGGVMSDEDRYRYEVERELAESEIEDLEKEYAQEMLKLEEGCMELLMLLRRISRF